MDQNEITKICKALDGLDGGQKTIVSLRIFEDLSFREIANIMVMSELTVKRLYDEAKDKLQCRL